MSKGTPITCVRIPPDMLAQVDALVERSITHAAEEPWTRTSWIVQAIREKLAKRLRSNSRKRRKSNLTSNQE